MYINLVYIDNSVDWAYGPYHTEKEAKANQIIIVNRNKAEGVDCEVSTIEMSPSIKHINDAFTQDKAMRFCQLVSEIAISKYDQKEFAEIVLEIYWELYVKETA